MINCKFWCTYKLLTCFIDLHHLFLSIFDLIFLIVIIMFFLIIPFVGRQFIVSITMLRFFNMNLFRTIMLIISIDLDIKYLLLREEQHCFITYIFLKAYFGRWNAMVSRLRLLPIGIVVFFFSFIIFFFNNSFFYCSLNYEFTRRVGIRLKSIRQLPRIS